MDLEGNGGQLEAPLRKFKFLKYSKVTKNMAKTQLLGESALERVKAPVMST